MSTLPTNCCLELKLGDWGTVSPLSGPQKGQWLNVICSSCWVCNGLFAGILLNDSGNRRYLLFGRQPPFCCIHKVYVLGSALILMQMHKLQLTQCGHFFFFFHCTYNVALDLGQRTRLQDDAFLFSWRW